MTFPMRLSPLSMLFLAAAATGLLYWAAVGQVSLAARQKADTGTLVKLPLFVEVALAGGDRYLAANIGNVRAMVASVEPNANTLGGLKTIAAIQQDVSWLNPGHEDNYYIAAAILPWNGELDAAQRILARATMARRFDYQPAFYYAFDLLHFKGDVVGASNWMREAAEYLPEGDNRLQMQNLAAIWLDKAGDLDLAIGVVEAMAKQANRGDFRRYLEQRVVRLQKLRDIRTAAAKYQQRFGRPIAALNDLVASGIIAELPKLPFGFGFAIDKQGQVVLQDSPPTAPERQH